MKSSVSRTFLLTAYMISWQLSGMGTTESPLIMAFRMGDRDGVRLLLATNVDIHQKSTGGYTPLHYAMVWQDEELAKNLLAKGALPNTFDTMGMSPLMLAAVANNSNLISLLIQHGGNPDLKPQNCANTLSARELAQARTGTNIMTLTPPCAKAANVPGLTTADCKNCVFGKNNSRTFVKAKRSLCLESLSDTAYRELMSEADEKEKNRQQLQKLRKQELEEDLLKPSRAKLYPILAIRCHLQIAGLKAEESPLTIIGDYLGLPMPKKVILSKKHASESKPKGQPGLKTHGKFIKRQQKAFKLNGQLVIKK